MSVSETPAFLGEAGKARSDPEALLEALGAFPDPGSAGVSRRLAVRCPVPSFPIAPPGDRFFDLVAPVTVSFGVSVSEAALSADSAILSSW